MELPALITALLLMQYIYFVGSTGTARGASDVKAPAMTGNETFERKLRVQLNTLEQLIITLPALWLCAFYFRADVASAIGFAFLLGRFMYGFAYITDPTKRGTGMIISFLSNVLLVLLALWGIVNQLI